jgi:hypothetical protein
VAARSGWRAGSRAAARAAALARGAAHARTAAVDSARLAYRAAVALSSGLGDSLSADARAAMRGLGWQTHRAGEVDSATHWLARGLAAAERAGRGAERVAIAGDLARAWGEDGPSARAFAAARRWADEAARHGTTADRALAAAHLLELHARAGHADSVPALARAVRWTSLPPGAAVRLDEALVHFVADAEGRGDPVPFETGLWLSGVAPRRRAPAVARIADPAERARVRARAAAADSARARTYRFAYADEALNSAYFRDGPPRGPLLDSLARAWTAAAGRGDVLAAREAALAGVRAVVDDRASVDAVRAWVDRAAPVLTAEQRAATGELLGRLLRVRCLPGGYEEAAARFAAAAALRDRLLARAGSDGERVGAAERSGLVARAWVATLLDLDRPWAALAALDRASARALRHARGEPAPAPWRDAAADSAGEALARAAVGEGGALLAFAPLPGDSLAAFVAARDSATRRLRMTVVRSAVGLASLPELAGGARLLLEWEGTADGAATRSVPRATTTEVPAPRSRSWRAGRSPARCAPAGPPPRPRRRWRSCCSRTRCARGWAGPTW